VSPQQEQEEKQDVAIWDQFLVQNDPTFDQALVNFTVLGHRSYCMCTRLSGFLYVLCYVFVCLSACLSVCSAFWRINVFIKVVDVCVCTRLSGFLYVLCYVLFFEK